MGTEADCATAVDPLVRSIRSELEYKARELAGRTSRISDPGQWRGLVDAVRLFAKRIGGSDQKVAADIGMLWGLYVAFGAYADSQETAASREIFVPLEVGALRALRDLIGASGPWIRMFPTGRAFDDQTPTSGSTSSAIVEAAAIFLRGVERTELLRDEDATILRAVLDGGGSAALTDKAGNWAIRTASNLGIAMLVVLAGVVRGYEKTADSSERSDVARRIERIVLHHEAHLLQVFSYLPDDIRNELRMAIEAIRASAADDV